MIAFAIEPTTRFHRDDASHCETVLKTQSEVIEFVSSSWRALRLPLRGERFVSPSWRALRLPVVASASSPRRGERFVSPSCRAAKMEVRLKFGCVLEGVTVDAHTHHAGPGYLPSSNGLQNAVEPSMLTFKHLFRPYNKIRLVN
jgi:hypothetical protein